MKDTDSADTNGTDATAAQHRHQTTPTPVPPIRPTGNAPQVNRQKPLDDTDLISQSMIEFAFPTEPADQVVFSVRNFRMYPNGLAFTLESRLNSDINPETVNIGKEFNLGARVRPGDSPKIQLTVLIDKDSAILTNKSTMSKDAPVDPAHRWLHGGSTYGRRDEARAEYFLSPAPKEMLEVVIAYPERGVGERKLEIPMSIIDEGASN